MLISFETPVEPRPLELLAALTRVIVDPALLGTMLASRPQENMKRDILSYGAPVPESAAQRWGVKGKLVGGVCGRLFGEEPGHLWPCRIHGWHTAFCSYSVAFVSCPLTACFFVATSRSYW